MGCEDIGSIGGITGVMVDNGQRCSSSRFRDPNHKLVPLRWNDGGYGTRSVVTAFNLQQQSKSSESNYNGIRSIGNYRIFKFQQQHKVLLLYLSKSKNYTEARTFVLLLLIEFR